MCLYFKKQKGSVMTLFYFVFSYTCLTLVVHPIVHAYLTKGWLWSIHSKWKRKFNKKLHVIINTNYHLTEFHFFDRNEEEIKL